MDQFGGPNGKKFKSRQLKELLLSINNLEMAKQGNMVEKAYLDWRGEENEQIDDVCIIGFKIT